MFLSCHEEVTVQDTDHVLMSCGLAVVLRHARFNPLRLLQNDARALQFPVKVQISGVSRKVRGYGIPGVISEGHSPPS